MRRPIFGIVALVFCIKFVTSTPLPGDGSLVISSTTPPSKEDGNSNNGDKTTTFRTPLLPTITKMNVRTNVSNRYAKTMVISKVKNPDSTASEATFFLVLPENAFISEFVMEIAGKSYKAYVKAKEEAKQIYNQARASGLSAAHVEVSARDSNKFSVSVNIEAQGKATFFLTYEELLQRQNNMYELVINIHPGQIVKDMKMEVHINESRSLAFVQTPPLRSGNEISKNSDKLTPTSDIRILNLTSAVVIFEPTDEDQRNFGKELGSKEGTGLSGQFIVQYQVEEDPQGGEVLMEDGYFVHFFAPSDLNPLPKQVIFVLDISGSMSGGKIDQLKDAMKSILNQIKGDNLLSIVTFEYKACVYDIKNGTKELSPFNNFRINELESKFKTLNDNDLPESVETTDEIIEKAQKIAASLEAGGLTNMMSGLLTGLSLVQKAQSKHEKKYQPIIIFLTDGQPTSSSSAEITEEITKLNKEVKALIFSLSFGYGADKAFLREFSTKNHGFSRHIYEASDASLQLQQFYKQISSPLLSNVEFKYQDKVENVTNTRFPIYFKGSELVVSGRYDKTKDQLPVTVGCFGFNGTIELKPTTYKPVSSLERLWAYLTVRQTLQEREGAADKDKLTKKALDLALKYSFVTDVTSLVVVKPNETASAVDTVDGSENRPGYARSYLRFGGGGGIGVMSRHRGVAFASFGGSGYYAGGGGGSYSRFGGAQAGVQQLYSLPRPASSRPAPPQLPLLLNYSTTTPATPILPSTSTTTRKPTLKEQLPWLQSILNSNYTITLAQGTFDLGEDSNFADDSAECQHPITGNSTEKGVCTLLKNCPQGIPLLTDFEVYKQHFCPLDNNKYAGICCNVTP